MSTNLIAPLINIDQLEGVVKTHTFTSQSILFSRQGALNKKQNKLQISALLHLESENPQT